MKKGVLLLLLILPAMAANAQMVTSNPHLELMTWQQVVSTVEMCEATWQSIDNQIKQIDQMRQQIEQNAQMLEGAELRNLQDFINLLDSQLTFLRNMEAKIKSSTVQLGGTEVPLLEFWNVARNLDIMGNEIFTVSHHNYTEEESAYILSHYGISPANYFWVKEKERYVENLCASAAYMNAEMKKNSEMRMEEMKKIQAASEAEQSPLAQAQYTNQMLGLIGQMFFEQQMILGNLGELSAVEAQKLSEPVPSGQIRYGASEKFIGSILEGDLQ
jgi:hypothetical protein